MNNSVQNTNEFFKVNLKGTLLLKSKSINSEGNITYMDIYSDYFYKNDVWHVSNFKIFNQFHDDLKDIVVKGKMYF